MAKIQSGETTMQSRTDRPGFWARLWKQQKTAAYSESQRQFTRETVAGVRQAIAMRGVPTRVETFEAAVRRLGLTEDHLRSQFRQFAAVQLALYVVAAVLLVYALWTVLSVSVITGFGITLAAVATAIQAYVIGLRAWQIKNRNLIRLQDAFRRLDTYLVI